MKANRRKLELAMAKAAGMPRPTVNSVIGGRSSRPGTIGRIAKALGVDVTEIIDDIE